MAPDRELNHGESGATPLLLVGVVLAIESLALRAVVPDAGTATERARPSLALIGWLAPFRFAFLGPLGSALLFAYLAWSRGALAVEGAEACWRRGALAWDAALVVALLLATPSWR